jgi:ABC-type branched-subunit amino acid transport system ATPase component/ABC-type branched-subunit amino acid transport system permease subunit
VSRGRLALLLLSAAVLPPVAGRVLPGPFNQYHSLVLCFGVAYVLAALPLNLLMGYAGQISLGHAAFLGVGAYTSGIIAGRLGLPFLLGLVVACVVGSATALVIGLPALRIRGLYLALVTLGFGLAMTSMVFRLRSITAGYAGLAIPRPEAGTFVFSRNADLLGLLAVILVVAWALDANVTRTKVGRAFLALRRDEDVAASLGIDVARYKLLAFVLYGSLSAVAGAVLGHVIGFAQTETFTFDLSLLFVVVVVLGGLASRPGVALAAFFFGAAPRFFSFLRGWELVVAPLLVIYALVRHPGGLGEGLADVRRRLPGHPAGRTGDGRVPDLEEALVPPRFAPARTWSDGVSGERAGAGRDSPLEVFDVTVRFGGLTAVDGVSLVVAPAAITGLIGPNGAGKTTLFNVISGLIRPDGGRVLLGGHDVTALPAHRRVALGLGRTFQGIGLVGDLSVRQNLLLAQHAGARYGVAEALSYLGRTARTERRMATRADEALAALKFERYGDVALERLSHGQQRIVELAAALLTSPGLLLLDEPSAGMSPAAAEALAERLLQVRDELGQAILLIEHHLPLVMATCSVVHVMDAGRLLVSGAPEHVRRDPDVVAAYLGERVA